MSLSLLLEWLPADISAQLLRECAQRKLRATLTILDSAIEYVEYHDGTNPGVPDPKKVGR